VMIHSKNLAQHF